MDPKSNNSSPVLADASPANKSILCLSDLLPQSDRAKALSNGLYLSIPRKKALILNDVRSSGWLDAMKCSSPPPLMKTRGTGKYRSTTEDLDDTYRIWTQKYPSALSSFEQIMKSAKGKRIVLFLDYDGTLSPIVDNPDHAFMSDSMRAAVQNVATFFPTAIISGRSRDKVFEFVGLTELYYAGSHGLDIMSPHRESLSTGYPSCVKSANEGKEVYLFQPATEFVSIIERVFRALVKITEEIDGVIVENNKFCVSVHYRNVDEKNWEMIAHCVHEIMKDFPRLQLTHGRKVLELRPQINWDKGKAVTFVLESLGLRNHKDVVSIYVGDDQSDEDAFKVLKEGNHGFGILVSSTPKETSACYSLRDPLEVMQFLKSLVRWKKAGAVGGAFPIKN